MKIRVLFFLSILCFSCSKITPRRPIQPKPSTTILKETIKESKRLNALENQKIIDVIRRDSTTNYLVSPNGFWYTYANKITKDSPIPQPGDVVTLAYNIQDLEGNIIYSKEELKTKTYTVDKEDFIAALQYGIKLMKIGETITFVIPSYNAYGVVGDGKKIGINKSIKSTVTLINIKQ
ncbi:gliding motility-associated peptidyl-prolyl isomerase GldI [Polaribacter sp. WD7]|uniref:gliding motility-associated peptidyl-prolyl isomerase GldI n=1 Tax=Polaribacter sp. WD7 TaxID=2269061 RepID=UPI000DF18CBB|nr:gliding motility-associated peptidyl-prolyl isomerase GldI [Polaribacter sp. WD7]RCS27120.1 gliding motility-associated peptidyl-prolyl isomerase GldI [Polaribacter sp. WD7]